MSKMEELRARAEEFHEDSEPSHDFSHVERVENLAKRLADNIGANKKILRAAAILHDIGREKEARKEIQCHAEWGAQRAEKILSEIGFSEEFSDKVVHCIESHRYSNDVEPETVEAEILSDADNLDALGAVGVARVFSFGGKRGIPFRGEDSSLEHFHEKILNLDSRMYTEKAKEVAEERKEFVEGFLDRFLKEWSGED